MKPEGKPTLSSLQQLAAIEKLKHEQLPERPLAPPVAKLKAWQTRRMAATYADLLAMPRYKLACEFFLTDIYAPRPARQHMHLEKIRRVAQDVGCRDEEARQQAVAALHQRPGQQPH